MKNFIKAICIVVSAVFLFGGCGRTFLPEKVNNIVSNISAPEKETKVLDDRFNGRDNFYYSSLTKEGKVAYTTIYNSYLNLENFTVNVKRDELEYAFNCVLYDNPEIFWVGSAYSYAESPDGIYVEPEYRMTPEEINAKKIETDTAVNRVLALAGNEKSDYAKEKFFHDYICRNTVYDISTYGSLGDTVYNVLVDGKAICEGYARTMKTLLDMSGIYNYLVIGQTKNDDGVMEGHMWNVVLINGEFYHIDVTWDDSDGEVGELTYIYFNVTDSDIQKDHFDIAPSDNNCVSNKYNYYNVNGVFFNDFDNFYGMARPCASVLTDDLMIEMRFVNYNDYVNAKNKALNNEYDKAFFEFTDDVARLSGKRIRSKSYVYNDKFAYLCVIYEKY